jgi:pyruvate,orthophosphate dikinase
MKDEKPSDESTAPEGIRPLDRVLDDHAELRDLLARIREAPDAQVLADLLQRLEALLLLHFEREEGEPAFPLRGGDVSGAASKQLANEHDQVLTSLRELQRRLASAAGDPAALVREELAGFLSRLESHEARETTLLDDAHRTESSDPGASEALAASLRRTAAEVAIPADQAALLEMTESLYGVHEATRRLLGEINHRYVGWPRAVEELHRRATSDLAYYLAHERAPDAIDVFASLYVKAAEEASPPHQREIAIRNFLAYLARVITECGAAWRLVRPALERALERVDALLAAIPELAPAASPRVRHLTETALELQPEVAQPAQERCLELLATALREVYARWLALEDPVDWWREQTRADLDAALPEAVAAISHAHLQRCLEALDASAAAPLRERADALFALPDEAQIDRAYLDAASSLEVNKGGWQGRAERIRWLIRMLTQPALTAAYDRTLGEINRAFLDLLREADGEELVELLREMFSGLCHSQLSRSPTGLHLIARIGTEMLTSSDPDWAQLLIDELLEWDFPVPRFEGYTDDCRVRVDPAHLRTVRTYLTLIEANPERARLLVAALVGHLHLGGVFVSDTDLFQKDVSGLLNARIAPVYHPIKHLLKLFPVYFSDIGAEGELRQLSARIDELGERRDPLCHFLRKQSHIECNPGIIGFIEGTAHFFATGERAQLRGFVPRSLYEELDIEREPWTGIHRVFARLTEEDDLAALFGLDTVALERRLRKLDVGSAIEREKAALLFHLRALVGAKYELRHDDALARLAAFHDIRPNEVEALRAALAGNRHEEALAILLTALERLESIILRPERTEGFEDIYTKHHDAIGTASVYGRYREEKFDAMALSLRLESLVNALFDRLIAEQNFEFVNRALLERVVHWLHLMLRAVRVDGCRGRGLASALAMLEEAVQTEGVSLDQYIDIFQLLRRGVEQLVRIRFLDFYGPVLERLVPHLLETGVLKGEPGSDQRETALKASEGVLRDLIAQSTAVRQIDALAGRVLRSMLLARERLDAATSSLLMTYEGERACVAIDRSRGPLDGAVHLGDKGTLLKRLAYDGLPVPPGFILTTEVFRCRAAIRASDALRQDVAQRVRVELNRLERETGCRLGDPRRPLLLSVGAGSAISMPGILDTIVNVGMNKEVTEGLAERSGSAWGAWDAYRRLLQFWGMSHGIARDRFDALMRDAKQAWGARKKSDLPSEDMRDLALRYRNFLQGAGCPILDDPFDQLSVCIDRVMDSWDSEKARLYRRELRVAEEWGTAVIVQTMVYGNLHARSGSGVVFTCDPRRRAPGVRLYGDFTVQAQSEDVVSGLVETYPISEDQRGSEPGEFAMSLERDFPRIYAELDRHAHLLIYDRGLFHQEIEFTFESDDPSDLYLLQTRDLVPSEGAERAAFIPGEELEAARLAVGIGAGGGAVSGRCAHSEGDFTYLNERYPGDPIILLRPDTVPDDVPLLLHVGGMVTALGGATSYAALAAQRLGRVCVVGCRQLDVDERRGRSTLAGRVFETGDYLSIDGTDGSVYAGKHPTTLVRQEALPWRREATR